MDMATDDIQGTTDVTGGDDACWLHLLCPICGAMVTGEDGHRPGCDARQSEANAGN
jgi:hypothetical protein